MAEMVEIPAELAYFQLPDAVQERLHFCWIAKTQAKCWLKQNDEAEGLVELFLSLLHLRSQRIVQQE